MFKLENITKSPLTTILGLLIIMASVASVFITALDMDWTDAGVGVALGAAFLFAKDKNGNAAAMIVFLMSGICLSSCVTYEKCQDKFGALQDTITITKEVKVVIRDTVVTQADTISTYIEFRQDGKLTTDTVLVENPVTGMQLRYWRDEANRLRVECLKAADTVLIERVVFEKVQVDCPPVTQFSPVTNTKWYAKWWFWMLLGVSLWLVAITFIRAILKAIFK